MASFAARTVYISCSDVAAAIGRHRFQTPDEVARKIMESQFGVAPQRATEAAKQLLDAPAQLLVIDRLAHEKMATPRNAATVRQATEAAALTLQQELEARFVQELAPASAAVAPGSPATAPSAAASCPPPAPVTLATILAVEREQEQRLVEATRQLQATTTATTTPASATTGLPRPARPPPPPPPPPAAEAGADEAKAPAGAVTATPSPKQRPPEVPPATTANDEALARALQEQLHAEERRLERLRAQLTEQRERVAQIEQASRAIASLPATLHQAVSRTTGVLKESAIVDSLEADCPRRPIRSRNNTMRYKELAVQPGWRILVGGKPDGVQEGGDIVEAKNRQNRLFRAVPEYEKVQVQLYLWLFDSRKCHFREQFHEANWTTTIERNDAELANIHSALRTFAKEHILPWVAKLRKGTTV
jgi:hypothetical protein